MSLIIDVESKYPDAAELGELYRAAGFELYLVGGIVRDNLLDDGGHFTDFDLTTDATPEQSEQILRAWGEHTWDIGKEYGTISARKNGRGVRGDDLPCRGVRVRFAEADGGVRYRFERRPGASRFHD